MGGHRRVHLSIMVSFVLISLAAFIAIVTAQSNFICPEKDGYFEDTNQCDKYYDCYDGIPEERLCPDGLVFDPYSREREPCDHYFNVDCGDRLDSSHQRVPVTCVPVSMVSTLTPTHLFVTFSTHVLMVRLRSTLAHPDSGLMNTAVSATGQRQLTDKTAKLKLMLLRHPTDSSAPPMPQLMSLVSLTHIPSMLMPMTAPNSTSA